MKTASVLRKSRTDGRGGPRPSRPPQTKTRLNDAGRLPPPTDGPEAELQEAREQLSVLRSDLEVAERGAQDALRELETVRKQYAILYDHAPLAYVTLDRGGFIRDANLPAAELLGESRRKLCNTLFMRFVAKEDRRAYFQHLSRCRRSCSPAKITTDLRLVRGDGLCPVHMLSVPEPRAAPLSRPLLYRVALVDVSDIRRAEQTLKNNESRYRLLFELNPCPMYIFDENSLDFLDVNAAALQLYGYSREAFLSMTVKDIRPPDDVPEVMAAIRAQRRLLRGGTASRQRSELRPGTGVPLSAGEWCHLKRDGPVFDAAVTVNSIPYAGRNARLVMVNDISGRKQAESSVQHRLACEQLLAELSSRLVNVSTPKLDAAVDQGLAEVGRLMGVDRCYLFRVSADLATADNTHEWCAPGIRTQIAELRHVATAKFPWLLKRLRNGEPLCLRRVADIPLNAVPERQLMAQGQVQSVIFVPIRHGGKLTGIIGCDAVRGSHPWSETDGRLLRIVGETIAEAQVRSRINEALRVSALEWQVTFDGVADAVWVLDSEQHILHCNKAAIALFKKSRKALVGRHCWEIVHGTRHPIPECPFSRMKLSRHRESMELAIGERWYQVVVDPLIDPDGNLRGAVHAVSDITARKQAEDALRNMATELDQRVKERTAALSESTERLQMTLDAAHVIAWELDLASQALIESGPVAESFGNPKGFRIGTDADFFARVHPDDRANVRAQVERSIQSENRSHAVEFRLLLPDGSIRWVASSGRVERDAAGRPLRLRGISRDITDRKKTELLLNRTNRALRVLTECGHILLRGSSEQELLDEACRIAVEVGGYRMAWVGYVEHDPGKSIRPMAWAGFVHDYFSHVPLTWGDTPRGCGPGGIAIRTGQPCVCRDLAKDPRFKPWRAEALKRGYGSALALPLLAAPANLGVMAIYSAQPNAFDDSEVQLLEQLARDLAFGILSIRGRAERTELTRQVLDISEREQRRLGQDFHDGVGQSIIGIGYLISAVQQSLFQKNVPEAAELNRIAQMVKTTVQQAHDLARGLFPEELRNGRIADVLQELARRTQDMFGTICHFTGGTGVRLGDANLASQVYRIAQEAVNNAVKHSKAPTIHIHLTQRFGRIILTVRDSGVGFTPQAGSSGGMGQRIMKYRADLIGATLKVESVCGKGTTVMCSLPRKPEDRRRESRGTAPSIPVPVEPSNKVVPL